MKILILDNYDSFVYNLVQYVGEQGAEPIIYRNDSISLEKIEKINPNGIIISPGPGRPDKEKDVGICLDVIKKFSAVIPILGVCLGHQAIVYYFGGRIVQAKNIMHGKTSEIEHDGKGIFKGLENPIKVMRYNSLVVSNKEFPSELLISARTINDKEIFGVRHKNYPIHGVQFHPESILTQHGKKIIENFLEEI